MSCEECTSALGSASEDFWKKVDDRRIPVSATLELTYRCNFHCVHCYCVVDPARTPEELSTAEWKDVLDQLAAGGGVSVSFTGGDPFVRRDFLEIAEHARARRFVVRILTNASFLTEKVADRVAALKPANVSISLYGATRESYEAVTGKGDFYDRSIEGIRRLKARGVRMQLKFPMLRENFHERQAMIAFARELGIPSRIDAEIGPKDDGDPAPLAHALDDAQLETFVREFAGPLPKAERFGEHDRLCRPGAASLAVGPFGDVFPCMQIKTTMGNLRDRPFREIWEKSEALAEVRALRAGEFDGCNACSHFGPCKPCPGLSLVEQGSLTAPTPTTCRITEFRSRLPVVY